MKMSIISFVDGVNEDVYYFFCWRGASRKVEISVLHPLSFF